ncbi:hypothetical protein [Acetobacter okinawensis]|uniref:hypothetical protein n=1 Tax=Acetobacter okinawensis TaxID=1076594 RepID=UPI0004704336|nr:hypothetical protein [Acetobacter okinawensis]MBS0967240.1 hypothetical protein [Acetobacter okinawensis]MBS0987941.1 hypothetical protein [Acetobacter okinawensis]
MSALLHSPSDVENDIYTEIIKPFIIESIDILASVLKNTDISGRTHFIDMVYHDSNHRIEFALKLATLVMHEVSKISLPDAGAVAAHIVQLSPDLGIGTISTGQLLYASASHENKITTIDLDNVQYNDTKENTSLGFQVGKYLAYNYITSWTCMLAVSSEYDISSAFRLGGRESKNVINQLFFYDCIKSINIFSGISSVFDKIYKQAKLISTQI